MRARMGKVAIYALYTAHRLTYPLTAYHVLWRIPARFGRWYLLAFLRYHHLPLPSQQTMALAEARARKRTAVKA